MNLGTIGTGWIVSKFINAAKETNLLQLSAVYSRTEEKAKQFASDHDADNYYTDLVEMAESDTIDCVYIASPNSFHYEQAIMFLKHHKHVICEKPIFSNTAELEEAYKVAEENGVLLFEAIRTVHLPNFLSLKENLTKVGSVRSSVLHRIRYSSRYDEYLNGENPNVFSLEYSGGALVDLGVYPLAVVIALFGRPKTANYYPVILSSGIDGSGVLVLDYTDFTCVVNCSKISTSYCNSEIHGEKGTISIDDSGRLTNVKLTDIHSNSTTDIRTNQKENDMVYEIENFVGIIKEKDKDKYEVLKELSLDVLTITESARKQNGIVYSADRE